MSTKSPSRDELSVRPTSAAAASFISISKASSRVSCEVPGSSVTDIPNIMNLVVRMTSTNSKTIDMSSGSSQSSSDDDNDFNDVSSRLSESPDDYGGSGVEELSSGPLKKRRKRSTGDDFARSSSTFTAITSSAATNDNESTVAIKSEQIATSAPSKQTKRSRHPMKIHRELRPAPYYFYIDRSGEVDEDALAPLSPPLCTPNFVIKLHAILIREDVKKIIAWMPHGRAWKVIDQDVFQERILPQYFMQSNIASFHRQANGWGFRRILKGPDKGAFYNEYFLRAVPHLCKKMKRVGGAKTIEDANSSHEPNLWMITKEHPLPETLPTNDLNYVALKTINECITEGGPKAKMPFIHDIQKTVSDNANNNRSSEEVYSASSIAASARAFTNTAAANKAASSSSESGHFENNGQSSSAQNEVNSITQCSEGAVPVNTLESLSKMILQQSDLASRNGQERALTANGQVHFGNNGQASSTRNEVNSIPQCSEGAVPVNTLESLAKMILQQSDLASRNGQQERDLIANGQGGQSDLHSFATSQLTRTGQGIMNLGGYQQLQGCQQQQNQEYQASSTVQDLLDLIGRTSNAFSTAPQDDRFQTLAFPSIRTGQQSQDLASSSQRASNIQDMAGMTSRAAMNRDQTGFIEDYLRSMLGQRPTDVSNVHDSTAKASQTTLPANQQEIIECIIKSMLDQRMHLHQNQNQGTNVVQNGNSQAQHQATSRVSIPPAVASLHANQHEQDYQVGNNTGSMLLDRFQSLQQQYLGNAQVQGSSSLPGQSQSVFPLRSAMGSSISNDVPANLRDLVAEAIVTGIRIGSDYDNGSVSRHPQGQQQNNQRQQHQPRGNSNFGFSNNGRF